MSTEKLPNIAQHQMFVITKYLGPTNYRPGRVKATAVGSGRSVTVSWDHALNVVDNHLRAATAFYAKVVEEYGTIDMPESVVCCGVDKGGYVFTAAIKDGGE